MSDPIEAGVDDGTVPGDKSSLSVAVESDTAVWNAVAVDGERIFLSGPRWSGSGVPPLVVIEGGGKPRAYPDDVWNSWHKGEDGAAKFVDINALRLDGLGGLWVIDAGSPNFGGDPLPGAAKLVRIRLADNEVDQAIAFPPDIAKPGSYIDDVRFNGRRAYVTDAGNPGIIVIDMDTQRMRRVLDDHASTKAPDDRDVILDGKVVRTNQGDALRVQSDPLEISPDGAWFLFGPLEGPWHKVPTRLLDDFAASPEEIAAAVEFWADLPPLGGTTIDAHGTLYFSDLARDAFCRRTSDGRIETIVQDERLHWVDAQFLDADGTIWLPAAQLDRAPPFAGGSSSRVRPVQVFKLTGAAPPDGQVYLGR